MTRTKSTFTPHPGVTQSCPHCDSGGYVVESRGEHATARLCDCVGVCPACHGTGFVSQGDDFRSPVVQCRCRILEHRVRLFNDARIPARHGSCRRSTFDPRDPSVLPSFMHVAGYIDHFQPGGENRGLVLHGAVGRGKTHLMVAILRELIFEYGVPCRFVEFSHLLADLRSSFDRGTGASALIDPLVDVAVLAIDELGKGRATEWEGTVLDELVSRRYNAMGTILATTNYEPRPATGRKQPNLADTRSDVSLVDRVGDRVFSRIHEMCDFIPLRGEDYRLQKRGARR